MDAGDLTLPDTQSSERMLTVARQPRDGGVVVAVVVGDDLHAVVLAPQHVAALRDYLDRSGGA